jgi:hypothetical protein
MGNGQWASGKRQRASGNGQWAMGKGQCLRVSQSREEVCKAAKRCPKRFPRWRGWREAPGVDNTQSFVKPNLTSANKIADCRLQFAGFSLYLMQESH